MGDILVFLPPSPFPSEGRGSVAWPPPVLHSVQLSLVEEEEEERGRVKEGIGENREKKKRVLIFFPRPISRPQALAQVRFPRFDIAPRCQKCLKVLCCAVYLGFFWVGVCGGKFFEGVVSRGQVGTRLWWPVYSADRDIPN